MTPDLSLLLVHYASEGADCRREGGPVPVLTPETARLAAQVAHLTGEERRLLALGDEVRELALALGQQRFEAWAHDYPDEVASCRAAVGRTLDDGPFPAPPTAQARDMRGARVRLS